MTSATGVADFLSAFFPDPNEPIHVRAFKPRDAEDTPQNRPAKLTISRASLREKRTQTSLAGLNGTRGVYFVVNAGGDADEDITRFNAWFVESDSISIQAQHAALDRCPLLPSIRVETKKSVHGFWLIADQCAEEQWREIQLRLIAYFNGDPAIKNPSRVMRLPGFQHLSIGADSQIVKKRVECVVFEKERRYTGDEMLGAFPAVTPPERKPLSVVQSKNHWPEYVRSAVEGEAEKVASAANGSRNHTLNAAAFALAQFIPHGVIAEAEIEATLLRSASIAGLSEAEARRTIRSGVEAGQKEPRQMPVRAVTQLNGRILQPHSGVQIIEQSTKEWETPRALPDGLRNVPPMPESLLPLALRGWLADVSDRLQTPLEFAAVPALVALASVVGNQVRIAPKRRDDWRVVPNLWGAIIGRPGVMKSPAIAEAIKPLQRLVAQARQAHAVASQEWEFQKLSQDAQKKAFKAKLEQAAKKGQELASLRSQWESEEETEPHEKRYIVNDSSVEKLGELLNQNPNGLLLQRDELTGWLRSLDDERRPNDRAFFLEAWNGDGDYVYDRIGRGTLPIDTVTLSIIGGIQPDIFASYLRGALDCGEANDGLIQRFQVMVYPDSPKDWHYVDRFPETEAKNKAFAVYERLSQIDGQTIGASFDDNGNPFLRFAEDAQEFFVEWFTDLNQSLRAGDFEHPALEAHFSKYKSLMPSLALLFHLCEATGEVSLQAAQTAAAWCSFLEKHAQRIYGLGIGATAINAKTLAGHLQKGDLPDDFTARDVYAGKGWAGLTTPQPTKEALELLEDLHWLQSYQLPTGGKPKTVYAINPKVRAEK